MLLEHGTIVTLGGGGFSTLGRLSPIDDAILRLAPQRRTGRESSPSQRPRVCFVPTASGDDWGYAANFERSFAARAETSVLSLFTKHANDTWTHDPRHVLDQDVIYVGGGSTANLLAIWRLHGLPELLREAAANGTVLAGISAGMNCWFEASSTDSFGPLAPLDDGLGFLPGSACPHLYSEEGRAEKYTAWVADGSLPGGHAVDEHVALVWRDGALVDAIAERPGHTAMTVTPTPDAENAAAPDAAEAPGRITTPVDASGAVTTPIPTRLLGDERVLTVSALLYADDPMGLREIGAPVDEYDSEAEALVGALADDAAAAEPGTSAATSPEAVTDRVHRIFVHMFGGDDSAEDRVPPRERFVSVARSISEALDPAE